MLKIQIYVIKRINYGVQLRLTPAAGDGEVLADFYCDSKKKTLTIRGGLPEEFRAFLEGESMELRNRLLVMQGLVPGERRETQLEKQAGEALPAEAGWRLFTDGGCSPNPGPGGWGAVLYAPDGSGVEMAGYEPATTNNRMEMQAVVSALGQVPAGARVHIALDSRYVSDGMRWMINWKKKNWVTASGSPVKNRDLWEMLDTLCRERVVSWQWLRGHTGHPENERCDSLVHLARKMKSSYYRKLE